MCGNNIPRVRQIVITLIYKTVNIFIYRGLFDFDTKTVHL